MRVLLWTYDFWPAIGGGEVLSAELERLIRTLEEQARDLDLVGSVSFVGWLEYDELYGTLGACAS